jgi:hypothetical protein
MDIKQIVADEHVSRLEEREATLRYKKASNLWRKLFKTIDAISEQDHEDYHFSAFRVIAAVPERYHLWRTRQDMVLASLAATAREQRRTNRER